MITVTILTADKKPLAEGIPLQLLSRGALVASARTDATGVAVFAVDPLQVGPVAVRLDTASMDKDKRSL